MIWFVVQCILAIPLLMLFIVLMTYISVRDAKVIAEHVNDQKPQYYGVDPDLMKVLEACKRRNEAKLQYETWIVENTKKTN